MIRKTLVTLFILAGIVLAASCNPARPSPTSQANMPNPASVYCEQQGNKLEMVTATDGSQNGLCIFPDGSSCDEWAYFRGECGPAEQGGSPSASTEVPAAAQDIDSQNTSLTPPPDNATATVPAQVVINAPLDYCFAYPQGFTLLINGSQVEVMGPYSGLGGVVAGMVWIDVIDAPGRTALEIADEEVNAVVGLSPLRSTVRMGGEEALVLEGMPGQDAVRKIYIVHNELLYTLNFMPYQSDNDTANTQTETLFASVISSWVWISSGSPCPATY